MANPTESFFQGIPAFSDFGSVTSDAGFVPVPEDWFVLVADIVSSLKSVEAGRYQDVNLVGAACIVAVQETLGSEFPYIFGGDGATFVVSSSCAPMALAALESVRLLAEREFAIALRVGLVGVSELRRDGRDVLLGRFLLKGGQAVAAFRGGGVAEAERRVKNGGDKYAAPAVEAVRFSMNSLSCRWSPIPSEKGVVLTLIATAEGPAPQAVYREMLSGLDRILQGGIDGANPVHLTTMRYDSLGDVLEKERRLHPAASWRFLLFLFEAAASTVIFGSRLWTLIPFLRRYAESMKNHCDFQKFDDALRLVLDCTPEQAADIQAFLEGLRREGKVRYGTHRSDAALMTCFVRGLSDGQHMHFIDGDGGGYAMAAKRYKEQPNDADRRLSST